jgi:hypothetical protein
MTPQAAVVSVEQVVEPLGRSSAGLFMVAPILLWVAVTSGGVTFNRQELR